MSFLNVAVMLAILGLGMVASMVYYGGRGKKKMRQTMDAAAAALGGTVTQRSRMHYPRLSARVAGRPAEVFVHLSEGHRRTADIIYLVFSVPVRLPGATLVVEEGYFAAAPDRGSFNDVAGDYLAGLVPGRFVYADDEVATTALLKDAEVAERLAPLARFPSLVLGPDAVTVGKPYGGPKDLEAERLAADLKAVVALAGALEHAAERAPAAAVAEA
jgi:hypothetical protein